MRAMFYAASKEAQYKVWHADNILCEVHAYPDAGKYAIVNNSNEIQKTMVYDGQGSCTEYTLEPCAILWKNIK